MVQLSFHQQQKTQALEDQMAILENFTLIVVNPKLRDVIYHILNRL